MTFGKGVSEEHTWPAVLEQQLARRYPGRCLEVLNSGMPNTNFHLQYLHYLRHWRSFDADLVIAGFFVYNDSQLQGSEELYSPWWMMLIDALPATKNLALVRTFYYRGFLAIGERLVRDEVPGYFRRDSKGWQQFADSLLDLQRVASEDGTELAFALIPVPIGYAEYPFRQEHQQLLSFLADRGVLAVDLLDGLLELVARDHWVHASDGHPDPALHRRYAEQLQDKLPFDRWIGVCPPGSSLEEQLAGDLLSRGCRGPGDKQVGPMLRGQRRRSLELGDFVAGKRTGYWREAHLVAAEDGSEDNGLAAVVEQGYYREGERSGLWRELGVASVQRSSFDASAVAGWVWPAVLLDPDSWSSLARGRYVDGVRSGLWQWWRPGDESTTRVLKLRCFAAGEVIWSWKAGPGNDSDFTDRKGDDGGAQPGPEGEDVDPGPEPGKCVEGTDCSGVIAEGLSPREENCNDRTDDDGDQLIDCDDQDCREDPACRHLLPAFNEAAAEGNSTAAGLSIRALIESKGAGSEQQAIKPLASQAQLPLGFGFGDESNVPAQTIYYLGRRAAGPASVTGIAADQALNHPCP
ncbi:MAG: hypothetical protein CMP23_09960 [Rickettsiales bacterium]|nr:hypothetical protein [Rickettsiales bacterium]